MKTGIWFLTFVEDGPYAQRQDFLIAPDPYVQLFELGSRVYSSPNWWPPDLTETP